MRIIAVRAYSTFGNHFRNLINHVITYKDSPTRFSQLSNYYQVLPGFAQFSLVVCTSINNSSDSSLHKGTHSNKLRVFHV